MASGSSNRPQKERAKAKAREKKELARKEGARARAHLGAVILHPVA